MFLSLKIYVFKIQRQLLSRNTTMVAFEYASVSWYPENSPCWILQAKFPLVNSRRKTPPSESPLGIPQFFFLFNLSIGEISLQDLQACVSISLFIQ